MQGPRPGALETIPFLSSDEIGSDPTAASMSNLRRLYLAPMQGQKVIIGLLFDT